MGSLHRVTTADRNKVNYGEKKVEKSVLKKDKKNIYPAYYKYLTI